MGTGTRMGVMKLWDGNGGRDGCGGCGDGDRVGDEKRMEMGTKAGDGDRDGVRDRAGDRDGVRERTGDRDGDKEEMEMRMETRMGVGTGT